MRAGGLSHPCFTALLVLLPAVLPLGGGLRSRRTLRSRSGRASGCMLWTECKQQSAHSGWIAIAASTKQQSQIARTSRRS